MKRENSYEKRMLGSFLRNYLYTIIVPLVVGVVVCLISLYAIRQSTEALAAGELDDMLSRMEQQLSQLERTARYVANSEDTKKLELLDESLHGEFYSRMAAFTRELNTLTNANEEQLSQLYVYWCDNQKIATAETSYDFASFYPYFFRVNGMDAMQFQSFLKRRTGDVRFETGMTFAVRSSYVQVFDTPMLVYPFSVNTLSQMDGCVFILLNKNWLTKELGTLSVGERSWAVLIDDAGNVIAEHNSALLPGKTTPQQLLAMPVNSDIQGRKLLYAQSQITGWHIVCLADSGFMMRQVLALSLLFAVLLTAALLAGLILSYRLARSSARPLAQMMHKLPDTQEVHLYGIKAFRQLSQGIDKLLLNNTNLQSSLNEMKLQMPSLFLNRLYANAFSGQEDIRALGRSMGVTLSENENHVVVLFEIPDGDRPDNENELLLVHIIKQAVNTFLRSHLGEQALISEVAIHRTALLFSSTEEIIDDALEPFLNRLLETLNSQGLAVYIAVGSPFLSLSMAYASYNDALNLLNAHENFAGNPVSWYWRMPQPDTNIELSPVVRFNLVSYAENGSSLKLNQVLSWLYTENFVNRHLSQAELSVLCDQLTEIVRCLMEKTQQEPVNLPSLEEVKELNGEARFTALCDYLRECCAMVINELQSSAHQLAAETRQFIQEHYMDPEMGLKLAASRMHITETYLSRIFKKAFHDNFASYVEQIRIQHAKEYLQSSRNIADIALLVGYSSDHAFRRAFKRVTDMTPQQFRKQALFNK